MEFVDRFDLDRREPSGGEHQSGSVPPKEA